MRDNMPSADNFFYDLFKMNKTDNRPAGSLNYLGLTYESLNNLIVKAWNINQEFADPNEWRGVNIEEVMTFFEAGQNMFPASSDEYRMFKMAQRDLIDFLYPFMPMSSDKQHCEYLMQIFIHLDKKDSVISYNWDTIADFTLQRVKAVQLKNYAKLIRDENIKFTDYRDLGVLLKLHGSFNWMICQNKECKFYNRIRPPFKGKTNQLLGIRDLWKCFACGGGKLKPEIIPPVSNKMIHSNSFIREQWYIAREKLLDVAELVFIGYSFPPTDYYTEWLFRHLNFIEKGSKVTITVVNPEYGKKGSIVTKRYKTVFRGREIVSFKTLKDYAQSVVK